MSDENSKYIRGSQILNLPLHQKDSINETTIKSSPLKISENNVPNKLNKFEESLAHHLERISDNDAKVIPSERPFSKKNCVTPTKSSDDAYTVSNKFNEYSQKQSSIPDRIFPANNEKKSSTHGYTNLRPGDAHFLNEDVSKRIAHSLASKQLIQISTGGGIDKNLGALLNMMQTTKATNLTQNLAPQKNFDNSTKTKSQYEEIKIYPNPKFQLEHHEMNLTTTGSYVKANSELMKSFEGDIGMDKENKDDDSARNSEDNFSPETYKIKNINKRKIKTCGNKFCKTDLSCWNSKFTRVKSENNTYMMLCTNCAKAHRKGQYCHYCKQIYLDNDDDGKDWIQCDFCKKWVHVDCEQFHGDPKFSSICKVKDFLYFCPKCKKMKNKATGPKRKSYDMVDFIGKQPKKNKKRYESSHYNIYGANSNYDSNEFPNKSPKINEEIIHPYDAVLNPGNGNLADLKKVFYELPYIKQSGNTKKTNNGHPPNENSYNSIDHLMSTYGLKLSLTENEISQDLNCLKGIVEKHEESKIEKDKTPQNTMEIEDKFEKSEIDSSEKMENQNKQEIMDEEEENDDKKSQKSFDEENETDNNNNGSHGNRGNMGKKKQGHNSKNYSLRKIIMNNNNNGTNNNNNKPMMKLIETEEVKMQKEKIDSTRVLRNRKKNN